MRRPLKPFVTEYRGGARRASSPGPETSFFKSEPGPVSTGPVSTGPLSTGPWPPVAAQPAAAPEDGYEAALRAADALFSGAAPAAAPSLRAPSPEPAGEDAKPPTTGRILRVLDEPPTAEALEMERLEAERAPKKRGRKPGSKNKPKVAALTEAPVAAIPPAAPVVAAPALPAVTATAALAARAIATAPRRAEPAAQGERYAWVRTRLKPGQQWKRRLPKVAW